MWHVYAPEVAPGQNAPPQGVEKVHYECRMDIESSDRGQFKTKLKTYNFSSDELM